MNEIALLMFCRRETLVTNRGLDSVKLEKGEDRIHSLLPADFQNAPVSFPYSAK